jgi:glycerophosphoryl diester phosphodiesterase
MLEIPIYAHRFGSEYGPESSAAALERTLDGPIDGIEVDVLVSLDERVIALHDPYLPYCCTGTGWAHETPAAEILRERILDDAGEPTHQPPLALEAALELVPAEMPLQLDVKAYADESLAVRTAQRACEVVEAHGTAERLEIISFFTAACEIARRRSIAARLVAWADYDPGGLVDWVRRRDIGGVSLEGFMVLPEMRERLKAAGISLSVGAVNAVDQLERLLPLEPDILVSDRPHELRRELDRLSPRD